ncbi:unnamed protein product, partial [Oncorhynchus mykiss]
EKPDESKLVQHKQSRRKTRPSYLTFLSVSFHLSHYFLSLLQIFRDYREIDIDIYLAGCQVCVVEQLSRASFFSESIPKSRLFTTVHDAVLHSLRLQGASDVPIYECALDMACTTKM